MGARKKVVTASPAARSRGRSRETASFPLAPLRAELPEGYAELLREIRQRIQWERLRTVIATKPAMVLLYGDIPLCQRSCPVRSPRDEAAGSTESGSD